MAWGLGAELAFSGPPLHPRDQVVETLPTARCPGPAQGLPRVPDGGTEKESDEGRSRAPVGASQPPGPPGGPSPLRWGQRRVTQSRLTPPLHRRAGCVGGFPTAPMAGCKVPTPRWDFTSCWGLHPDKSHGSHQRCATSFVALTEPHACCQALTSRHVRTHGGACGQACGCTCVGEFMWCKRVCVQGCMNKQGALPLQERGTACGPPITGILVAPHTLGLG